MSLRPLPGARFIRRTELRPDEYRKNFHQIDREILSAVTSEEADRITPLMSKIYLRMVNAPEKYWERDGVLRIEAEVRDEGLVKAWSVMCELVGVASATASKALRWMHEQGIIGYFSGKNGVGLRIFLNRAASSIGVRPGRAGKKILAFAPASLGGTSASTNEPASMDSFADSEVSDTDINPRAPKNGAETKSVGKMSPAPTRPPAPVTSNTYNLEEGKQSTGLTVASIIPVEEIVERLRSELEPPLREAARATAQFASREMERTREWFETKALPKAVRVAQHETYSLLRKQGGGEYRHGKGSAGLEVGRPRSDYTTAAARRLTPEEIRETAEVCIALMETQGKSVEVTLSEISSERGGWLPPEDAPRVREAARELTLSWGREGKL